MKVLVRFQMLIMASLFAIALPSFAQTSVTYGKVTAVKATSVAESGPQVAGALFGGALGLLSGRHHSGSNQALRAVTGGVAGQQLTKMASTKQAFDYTIVVGGTYRSRSLPTKSE